MTTKETNTRDSFSIVVGGPFHSILRQIGLVDEDQLPSYRAILFLVTVAWLPGALLATLQALFDGNYSGWGYFSDPTVLTRYIAAIWVMVATERYADGRIKMLTRQFREARLLLKKDLPGFSKVLVQADRRSSSATAEVMLLGLAIIWSGVSSIYLVETSGSSWIGVYTEADATWSWAGHYARFVATPLFLFLVFRWMWRFAVWTLLLFNLSRLPLQLTPLHPDRAAGLGFLSIYPSIFSGFILALSCVVAAAAITEIGLVEHSANQVWLLIAGWIALNLVLFLGPLTIFSSHLYKTRETALLEYGGLASQHHLMFHRKWIMGESNNEQLLGSPDPSSVSDLNAAVQAVQDMRVLPVDRFAVVQLIVAAGVPMLAVAGTQLPLSELAKWLVSSLF